MLHSAFQLLSRPPEAYLIVFALALGDAVLPILPSETGLIAAGLLCVVGHLSLPWVILAGAVGAFLGDTISYCLGRFVGRPAQERYLNGKRSRAVMTWAGEQFRARGGLVLIVARYIPGGRTAATFTGGLIHYPYPNFALFDGVGAATWATYGALLGYLGGRFFRHHAWAALLVALVIACAVTLAVEGVRRLRR